ncbi:Alpha/beta hydrolase fold-1 [Akanthomyces lecanii RCEF 1005]|uniref:Alpha/beta hydrolase fold-1 n=1 Tax=Akanthomyces lecanii RCEF 1005 TaxID=1081108 RepID=A0A168IUR5_CORDF|nr:Alpha/beta hydrolase fold-1 [Akanthomyces lecanii RCEF 1005]
MKTVTSILLLTTSLILGAAATSPRVRGMANDFGKVPLDYANNRLGKTSIAFLKLAGTNATAESPSIVIIPGGPGASGVDLLLSSAPLVRQIFGDQYNIVSFDPRGVNNSGPSLDCFSENPEARLAFNRLHNTGVTNVSSTSLEEQYYSSAIYGEWCNHAVDTGSPHGYYVTTPAVARDLLTFVEAEAQLAGKAPSEAKLWSYGISYGTAVGATFASMFPDRVERMVLDGIVDAELYYRNAYTANAEDMDKTMERFVSSCHSAGPQKCCFWGPTPENITARLDNIVRRLQNHPVPISGAQSQDLPTLVTYSDLKALFLTTIYTPLASFPMMAEVLHQVEQGNASALTGAFQRSIINSDANHVIQCADAYRTNSLTTIEDFRSYVEYTVHKSKYIGDIYPIYVDNVVCRAFRPQLPDSMVVAEPKIRLDTPTYFPIVFASNTIDPITPLIS